MFSTSSNCKWDSFKIWTFLGFCKRLSLANPSTFLYSGRRQEKVLVKAEVMPLNWDFNRREPHSERWTPKKFWVVNKLPMEERDMRKRMCCCLTLHQNPALLSWPLAVARATLGAGTHPGATAWNSALPSSPSAFLSFVPLEFLLDNSLHFPL